MSLLSSYGYLIDTNSAERRSPIGRIGDTLNAWQANAAGTEIYIMSWVDEDGQYQN